MVDPNKALTSAIQSQMKMLFDLNWYQHQTGRTWDSKISALNDYLKDGWRRSFDPHPLFSTRFYLDNNPDVAAADMPPLYHFAHHGFREGRDPHPMFHLIWYKTTYAALLAAEANPLIHYLSRTTGAGVRPNPDFDSDWYARTYAGLLADGVDPLTHFVTMGAELGLARTAEEYGQAGADGLREFQALRDRMKNIGDENPDVLSESVFPISQSDLASVELLSLDIWDTVLRRDCYPDEIKLQTCRFLVLRYYWNLRAAYRSARSLFRSRIAAENQHSPKHDFEYRFAAVAPRWLQSVLEPSLPAEQLERITAEVLAHEFKAESRSIHTDPSFKAFVEQTKLPTTIFVSDFYYESTYIRRLLASQGLDTLFAGGYSSSDFFKSKRTGDLFRRVLADFAVAPGAMLHVGDTLAVDVVMPQSLGIAAVHYDQRSAMIQREQRRARFTAYLDDELSPHAAAIRQALAQHAHSGTGPLSTLEQHRAGIGLAPLAVGYVLSIIEQALTFGVERVYFLTREGQFFQELYDTVVRLDPYTLGDAYPKSHLLEVSRLATFAASMETDDCIKELMRLWTLYSQQSLRAVFRSLNFDDAVAQAAAKREGIDLDEVVEAPWQDLRVRAVLSDPVVATALTRHRAEQRALVSEYLRQEQVLDESRAVVLVDIGWRGSIQDNLCKLAAKHIHGCYLGLFQFLNAQPRNSSKSAWIHDENAHFLSWIGQEIAPLEMIFNGTGGSVIGYRREAGRIVAERRMFPGEEDVILSTARPLQAGIVEAASVVCDYVRRHGLVSADIRDLARQAVLEFLTRPASAIAQGFFRLAHNETFGTGAVKDMAAGTDLPKACAGLSDHQLHAAATDCLVHSQWRSGLLALEAVKAFYDALPEHARHALPFDLPLHYRGKPKGRHDTTPRLAIYAPAPIRGSGGHRTIFNIARRAHQIGFGLFVYLESEGDGFGCVEEFLQGTPAQLAVGWDRSVSVDFALATIAHSAAVVAEHSCAHKGYLVQDFEAAFNPLSDEYVVAENSYCQGLTHFTIGRWLTHVLGTQFDVGASAAGLGVDTGVYRPLPLVEREDAVCFLYQPEKPRRAPRLGIDALRRVKAERPDVKIYVYGSEASPDLDFEVEHLGLITNLQDLNVLYNRCKVGLCISLSNPSRIPYEMMAAGTVPIDLYRYNNLFDHDGTGAILAYQGAASLAEAMISMLGQPAAWQHRSNACIEHARTRTLSWEQDVVANAIAGLVEGAATPRAHVQPSFLQPPVVARKDHTPQALAFLKWQAKLASAERA